MRHRSGRRPAQLKDRVGRLVLAKPKLTTLFAVIVVAGGAGLLLGPVAGIVGGLYAVAAVRAGRGRLARRAADRAYDAVLAAIDAAAGDLRAGLAQDGLAQGGFAQDGFAQGGLAQGGLAHDRPAYEGPVHHASQRSADAVLAGAVARLAAAYRLSAALGAPLADLLDQVDADLRASRRLRLTVQAQTSGAQATGVLLAALPVFGLALGVSMGYHPLHELLHTPIGGVCAVAAVLLQCAGLAWTSRLVRAATTAVA